MIQRYIYKVLWLLSLVLLQALILNNIHVAGCATPFLYVYLLLRFESTVGRKELMVWAFVLGLMVDMFSDTPGMNAAASVLLAFARPTILRLFVARDTLDSLTPSLRSLGFSTMLKYVATSVAVHHIMLLSIESFSTANLWLLVLRIVCSSALTISCVMAIEGMRKN